jgi:transposase
MKLKEALGIDVSKNTIDANIFIKKISPQFSNDKKGFKALIKWLKKHAVDINELIICFEHTGIYSIQLAVFFESINQPYSIIPGIEIKKSLGMVRGENNIIDAIRIAEYAYMRKETLTSSKLPTKSVQKLQKLNTLRARMVKHRTTYLTSIKELKGIFSRAGNILLFKEQESIKQRFDRGIKSLDKEILRLIKADKKLKNIYKLIITVGGIGPVLAVNFIINTNGYITFTDSRKFACYCGIVPFTYQSGTSIRSASKVSHYADKKMKSLLNLAVFSAIQYHKEMIVFYERRVKEGKSKMSTINIVRNKIVHRVFAVVKRGTPYVELANYAA